MQIYIFYHTQVEHSRTQRPTKDASDSEREHVRVKKRGLGISLHLQVNPSGRS